jgi:cytochrome c1
MRTLFLISTECNGGFMAAIVADKYHLKSIHEEIDLFDRKLAHLEKFEKFESDEERDQAARKLTLKRETLVQAALRLAAEGVEFKPNDLPRSLRPKDDPAIAAAAAEASAKAIEDSAAAAAAPTISRSARRQSSSPYSGTSLDWQASVREYMHKKNKA